LLAGSADGSDSAFSRFLNLLPAAMIPPGRARRSMGREQNEDGAASLHRRLAQSQCDPTYYLPSSAWRVNSSFCYALALSYFCT